MAHDIFISYASGDKHFADAVCTVLEQAGIPCWMAPRDILPSASWGEAIVDAIYHSKLQLVIFSAKANASPQVTREVERAVNRGVPILPFRVEDVTPTKALEYFLAVPHWLDAVTPPFEQHIDKLLATVAQLFGTEVTSRSADEGETPKKVRGPFLEVPPQEWARPRSRFLNVLRDIFEDR
ncbi:MAG: toll/interleukin-1 receptor domain-containing protein [Egibacteraceae bacterium]